MNRPYASRSSPSIFCFIMLFRFIGKSSDITGRQHSHFFLVLLRQTYGATSPAKMPSINLKRSHNKPLKERSVIVFVYVPSLPSSSALYSMVTSSTSCHMTHASQGVNRTSRRSFKRLWSAPLPVPYVCCVSSVSKMSYSALLWAWVVFLFFFQVLVLVDFALIRSLCCLLFCWSAVLWPTARGFMKEKKLVRSWVSPECWRICRCEPNLKWKKYWYVLCVKAREADDSCSGRGM